MDQARMHKMVSKTKLPAVQRFMKMFALDVNFRKEVGIVLDFCTARNINQSNHRTRYPPPHGIHNARSLFVGRAAIFASPAMGC